MTYKDGQLRIWTIDFSINERMSEVIVTEKYDSVYSYVFINLFWLRIYNFGCKKLPSIK